MGGTPLATVNGYLATGYAGGAWTGNGINSSTAAANAIKDTAIGIGESQQIFGGAGVFSGVAVDATALLLKYTFYGDASLSGNVDTIDFNSLASNFAQSGRYWALGDFNYNGTVNTIDFNLLAANFAKSGLAPAAAAIAAKSPAPQQPQRSIASEIFSDDEMIQ